jgi:hypothetical protein
MSRTYKDVVQQRSDLHQSHPYWRYRWWLKHGPSDTRRVHNRLRRAKAKQAIREGKDPPREARYLPWVWW